MPDYLSHHGYRRGAPEDDRTSGPPCEVCGGPMLAGQRRRHAVCSPRLECCDTHEDLVPDLVEHRLDHVEAGPPPTRYPLGTSIPKEIL